MNGKNIEGYQGERDGTLRQRPYVKVLILYILFEEYQEYQFSLPGILSPPVDTLRFNSKITDFTDQAPTAGLGSRKAMLA
jgi:hypothetical protein